MFEILDLLWRFFSSQPFGRYFQLHPWHLQVILMVLGLQAAGGLHHLIGYTFRAYRVNSDYAHWLGMPTLVLLLFSVQALLACYTLVTQAESLVRENLNTEETIQPAGILGEQLLAPAFASADLANYADGGVSKERLTTTMRALPADEYRNSLKPLIVDPDRISLERDNTAAKTGEGAIRKPEALPAAPSGTGKPESTPAPAEPPSIVASSKAELTTAVLVQIALRWLTDPQREWPKLSAKPDAATGAPKEPVLLPEFMISLVSEIQDGVVLERLDWEHVAGHRFSAAVMQPMLVKYVTRTAITCAVLVLILNAFYFFGFYRLRRWMARKRAAAMSKASPSPADAMKSPPH